MHNGQKYDVRVSVLTDQGKLAGQGGLLITEQFSLLEDVSHCIQEPLVLIVVLTLAPTVALGERGQSLGP